MTSQGHIMVHAKIPTPSNHFLALLSIFRPSVHGIKMFAIACCALDGWNEMSELGS